MKLCQFLYYSDKSSMSLGARCVAKLSFEFELGGILLDLVHTVWIILLKRYSYFPS